MSTSPGRRLRRARERQHRPIAPTIVAYNTETFTTAEEALRAAARAQGCTCDVRITLAPNGHAHAAHDDWCALLRREDTN
jgi:hypothetical protein